MVLKNILAKRLHRVTSSGIRKMFELAKKIEGSIDLGIGQPDFDTPTHIKDAAKKAIEQGENRYTPNKGLLELRELISQLYDNLYKVDIHAENIVVTCGACQAIYAAITGIIDPGDEVIIPDPGFLYYNADVRLSGGIPVPLNISPKNNFVFSEDALNEAITSKTKMIIINYPSNPTGANLDKKDARTIAEIAEDNELIVLSDEVYDRIVYEKEHNCFAKFYPEGTLVVNSFSKAYAMAGWRLGYIFSANPALIDPVFRIIQYNTACANAPAQIAGIAALQGPQDCVIKMVTEYRKRRDYLVKKLNSFDFISCVLPGGAFYAFPKFDLNLSSDEISKKLLSTCKIVTVPGTAFGPSGETFVRFSYSTSLENIQEAMGRFEKNIDKLSN